MGDSRTVISVIAIVSVLVASGIALNAFADHEPIQAPTPTPPEGKSAYMFDCAGAGGEPGIHVLKLKKFMEDNNGYYHNCAHNWINHSLIYPANDRPKEDPDCEHKDQKYHGNPVRHNCGLGDTNPPAWEIVLKQFDAIFPQLTDGDNQKLIVKGYSWGGGLVSIMAGRERCYFSGVVWCDWDSSPDTVGPSIDDTIPSFRDTTFDFVWLTDPVGPDGLRATITTENGYFQDVRCCTDHIQGKVFGDNVRQVMIFMQNLESFPTDYADGGNIFKQKEPKVEQWYVGDEDLVDPGARHWDELGLRYGNGICDEVVAGTVPWGCHLGIVLEHQDPDNVQINRGMEYINSMNIPPFFEPGVLPTQITLDEGDVDSWPIHTPDGKTAYEDLGEMNMTFRDLTTSNSLKFDIDIDQGSLSNINNNRLRSGSFDLNTYDNFTTNIILQVEDNGFPCGGCTDGGTNEAAAMGAKGYWDRESISVTVHNVPPTIENFETLMAGFNVILLLETSDPSIRDEEAGFVYTIDWGDGPPETVHGEVLAQIKHEYTNSGKYTITVFATDKDGDDSVTESDTVYTPFVKLLDDFDDLVSDGTLNNGQGNSFKSKINAITKNLDKHHLIPACNVAEALINEVEAFVQSGKLTEQQRDELIEKIEKSKDQIGCNGSIIVVEKQTSPADHPAQWAFTGDAAGVIADNGQIQVNVTPGQYTSTEALPWPDGWELQNIICTDDNSTVDINTFTATFNVEEDEYVVCIFINADFDLAAEQSSQTSIGRGSTSASDTAISDIRLHSSNSNPSSPQTSDNITDDKKGGGGDEHLTRPTFGVSHETFETIVDSGFRFNDQSFTINDNFHTPFAQQTVNIGEVNSFEAKIYADKRLKVQEFLFGIPNVGEAHLAELGVEVWYDYNGEIEEVKAIQKSNVIDKETIVATHEKTKCQATDVEERCDVTNVSMLFLEPLKDKVMAVKAIDYKGRYQITYLNEGVEIAGESLNPMQTYLIPSNVRDQGLIKVTQLAKYSPYWQSDDDRMFEMNSFGSFKEINITFERFQDTGNPYTRLHSGFGGIIAYELKRATGIFDSSEFVSELPESFAYLFPKAGDRMTEEMKAKMLEQEEIAKKIIEESKVQARW